MSYFSSLARQSGIQPFAGAPPKSRTLPGLELDATHAAAPEPPAADPPSLLARPAQESAARMGARPAAVNAPVPHRLVDIPAPGTLAEFEIADPPREQPSLEAVNARLEESSEISTGAALEAVVRVGQSDPPPAARERRRPTLAEVRAWVAQPLRESPETELPSAPALPKPQPAVPQERETLPDAAANYTLEIGTIQIVIDEPAVAAPLTQAPRPAPPAPAGNHPSRYYLR